MASVEISVRSTEGSDGTDPFLLWDTVWNADTSTLDWALAGTSCETNRLGLRATRAFDTAIMIQLATRKRAPSYMQLPSGSDPHGWWGDTVDLQGEETELGSWLWLLYRSTLTEEVARKAVSYVQDCLAPLLTQGAVASFDVNYQLDTVKGMLGITIDGYSQDGQRIYSQQFSRLWQQEFASLNSNPTNRGPAYYGSML